MRFASRNWGIGNLFLVSLAHGVKKNVPWSAVLIRPAGPSSRLSLHNTNCVVGCNSHVSSDSSSVPPVTSLGDDLSAMGSGGRRPVVTWEDPLLPGITCPLCGLRRAAAGSHRSAGGAEAVDLLRRPRSIANAS